MNDINWNTFKAKFNDREQKSFELLSYLLFCSEFNLSFGIFRYFNQTGIETEPIQVGDEWLGFQAKFYETKISVNKEDIKSSIKTAKSKNPILDKIYFYINQEFSESKKKDKKEPHYKTEIEDFAKAKNVKIEWRVPSHFEKQLFDDKNKNLSQHFFSLEKGIVDFIIELNNHTLALLEPIRTEIVFNKADIKIDRSKILANLKKTLDHSPLIILSGEGGVGKTALIKDFYNSVKKDIPFFIFKAAEFNVSHINAFFKNYGDFMATDFVKEYDDIQEKYIVVDSAEKLSDLEYPETFQEFLSILLQHKWKIIFTTRHSYLDDLKFQFVEHYRINFQLFNIDKLDLDELETLSNKFDFKLPKEEKFLELLRSPFYLNEFLQNYKNLKETTLLLDFKRLLWNKQILKSSFRKNNIHLKREKCFLNIAKRRANTGNFFVSCDDCDEVALKSLEEDEIIKYDSINEGYFITHDIYEEWSLNELIEREFYTLETYEKFFASLGTILPIRRAFRNWLSEKLFNNREEIRPLIENSFVGNEIERVWKDEILVSVLLSNYSEVFFKMFESVILADNNELLIKIIFLLRIACKEVDENSLRLLGIRKKDNLDLEYIFTKPKGEGWNQTIDFIFKHKEDLELANLNIIYPLLQDWNYIYKAGETTRKVSLIALDYFEKINSGRYSYRFEDESKQLINIIINGSAEIKNELNEIFNKIIENKEKNHRDTYYELIRTILSSAMSSFETVKNLPEQVLKLAELFWLYSPDEDEDEDVYRYSKILEVDDYFCISGLSTEYFPASAFQTPIFQLLRFAPKATIDFILSFTNKTVECYAKSNLDEYGVEEIEVYGDEKPIKQYISQRLWNTYRGTQVSPHLLSSIHMALERWLLDFANTTSKENLEYWCKYLIENSKSSSITAIIVSLILKYPEKLFNIAANLFRTKRFFFYDSARLLNDQSAKGLYSIGYGQNSENDFYYDERIKTCDDNHRKLSLEDVARNYQFFQFGNESDSSNRQEIIWGILDKYYEELPPESEQTEKDKTWRLCLARIDRRQMSPTFEEVEDGSGFIINFNPELPPELKQHSEESQQAVSEKMKYVPLKLWAYARLKNEKENYGKYPQYENNPELVVKETKEIVEKLNKGDDDFLHFNHSTPAYACAVLIRKFFDDLSEEDKEFCLKGIRHFASLPIVSENYYYQVTDGTEPAITNLSLLIKKFPDKKEELKYLLFLLLLNLNDEISTFAARSIQIDLWQTNFDDAQSLFLGYLNLKPKHKKLLKEVMKRNFDGGIVGLAGMSDEGLTARFCEKYEKELEDIINNRVTFQDIEKLNNFDLRSLNTAFELLPVKTTNSIHKNFVIKTAEIFSKKIQKDDEKHDFHLMPRFQKHFAYFVLSNSQDDIPDYIQPFIDNFTINNDMADFFSSLVSQEDYLNEYENFWFIWELFYERVVEACRKSSSYHSTKAIVYNYLLAWRWWKKEAKTWHSLKEREKLFFKKVAQDIGKYPPVLYSLSKFLNEIGSDFLEDGVFWISDILQKNRNTVFKELEVNTVYYLENIVRRFILINRHKIKTSKSLKERVTFILDFLVEQGSMRGYLIRESVL